MTIVCSNINEFCEMVYELHDLIKNYGVQVLKDYSSSFDSLKNHWMGSDADKNLDDLRLIYNELSLLILKLDTFVVEVYNFVAFPLLELLNSSGYDVNLRNFIEEKLVIKTELNFVSSNGTSYVADGMADDVSNFNAIPKKIEFLLIELNDKKDRIYLNWTSGDSLGNFKTSFITFNDDLVACLTKLNTVLGNLNIASSLKQKLMFFGNQNLNQNNQILK